MEPASISPILRRTSALLSPLIRRDGVRILLASSRVKNGDPGSQLTHRPRVVYHHRPRLSRQSVEDPVLVFYGVEIELNCRKKVSLIECLECGVVSLSHVFRGGKRDRRAPLEKEEELEDILWILHEKG